MPKQTNKERKKVKLWNISLFQSFLFKVGHEDRSRRAGVQLPFGTHQQHLLHRRWSPLHLFLWRQVSQSMVSRQWNICVFCVNVFLYAYVCVIVKHFFCMCVCVYVCMCVCVYVCMCVCVYVCMCVYVFLCICVHVYTYTCAYACVVVKCKYVCYLILTYI